MFFLLFKGNPFVTDRTQLEQQLTETSQSIVFTVKVADSIKQLKKLLSADTSDLVMAMIHKFHEMDLAETFPQLNTSPNILVRTDEAHRSQYKLLAANLDRGIPNATKIGYLTHVYPNGYKAQVVATSREAAVRYKKHIDAALAAAVAKLEQANPKKLDIDQLKKMQTDVIISGKHNDLPHLKVYSDSSKHKASIKSFKLSFGSEDEGVSGDMGSRQNHFMHPCRKHTLQPVSRRNPRQYYSTQGARLLL